jgi:peptidoglycan/xylan/chitin deacetylase (PgdA/CDA1 family)
MARTFLWLSGALLLGLANAPAAADTPFAEPMVTISIDDGHASQFDLARPALKQRGLKATYYLISRPIQESWTGYLSLAQARTLAAEGNEIGDHTVSHPRLTQVTAAQLDQELANSKSWLQSNLGLANIAPFASPYGDFNDAVLARVKAYFGSHRTQIAGSVFNDDDRYRLRGVYVRNTTTVGQIKGWIDQTIAEGSWLILTFHEFTSGATTRETQYTAANFAAVLDYIKSRGVAVVKVADGVAQMGTAQDTDPKRWIFGDSFGNDIEDWSWAKINFQQTAVVHDGRGAISFEPDAWGGLAFHSYAAIDPAAWPTLEFWVHGGAAGGQQINLALYDGNALRNSTAVDRVLGHAIRANTWEKVSVQFAQLGITSGNVSDIHLEDTTGGNQGTLYVDSIVLRKAVGGAPPPPPSVAPYVIYDEALRGGFQDWSWAVHDLAQTAVVHAGARGISFEPDAWAGIYFHHDGLNTGAWRSIDLYVNGGAAGGQDIVLAIWDGNVMLGQVDIPQWLGHALRPNTWEHVVVPLSALNAAGRPLRDLYIQDNSGANQAAVYVDDVRLIP